VVSKVRSKCSLPEARIMAWLGHVFLVPQAQTDGPPRPTPTCLCRLPKGQGIFMWPLCAGAPPQQESRSMATTRVPEHDHDTSLASPHFLLFMHPHLSIRFLAVCLCSVFVCSKSSKGGAKMFGPARCGQVWRSSRDLSSQFRQDIVQPLCSVLQRHATFSSHRIV